MIEPVEDMITVFMAQLHPGDPNTEGNFHAVAYTALEDGERSGQPSGHAGAQ